jgi:nicotinamidase-related amidase
LRTSSKAALLLVDIQNDFVTGSQSPIYYTKELVTRTNNWIKWATAQRIPIIVTQQYNNEDEEVFHDWSSFCVQDTWGAEIADEVALPPNPYMIPHSLCYIWTEKDNSINCILQNHGIKRLYVIGTQVENTLSILCSSLLSNKYEVNIDGSAITSNFIYDVAKRELGLLIFLGAKVV